MPRAMHDMYDRLPTTVIFLSIYLWKQLEQTFPLDGFLLFTAELTSTDRAQANSGAPLPQIGGSMLQTRCLIKIVLLLPALKYP